MKTTRKNLITILVAMMLTVSPFTASVYAEGETETEETILTQEEVKIEENTEIKEDAVIEVKVEAEEEKKVEEEKKAEEQKIEEIAVEEKAAAVPEAEEQKIEAPAAVEEQKIEAPAAVEEKKAEVPAEVKPEQAEAEKAEAPKEEAVVKVAPVDEALTVHVTNILWTIKASSNGNVRPYAMDQKISKGGSKTMTATGVLNWAGGKNTKSSDEHYSYTFLNGYVLSDGNGIVIRESLSASEMIKKIQNKGNGNIVITFADDSTMNYEGYELTISPAYAAVEKWHLDLRYTDNISTGSGSWSGSASSLSHTFRAPEAQPHYQFLYWENQNNGAQYAGGQKVTFNSTNTPAGRLDVYAIWQPSVTVNYYDHEGKLFKSVESFEGINVYDIAAAELEGCTFLGWKADENILAEDSAYNAPAVTHQKDSHNEIDVYAVYSTSYSVEHYLEDLNGDFSLTESTIVEDVLLGSMISAEANEYTGFSFAADNENTKTEGIATAGAALKFYYTRNSYAVLWMNEDGTLLEEDGDVKYLAMPNYDGATPIKESDGIYTYEFDKWSPEVNEVTEDVTYTASFIATLIPVIAEVKDNNVPSEPEVIVTPSVQNRPAAPAENTVTEEIEVVEIEEETAPKAEVEETVIEVIDEEIPMANAEQSWALINLLAAAISTLTALVMILSYFRNKEDDEDEEMKRSASKFLGIIPAAVSWMAFFLTENIMNPMVLMDRYTVIMLIIMAITLALSFFTRNQKEEEREALNLSTDLQ